jgi:hypothetical protein
MSFEDVVFPFNERNFFKRTGNSQQAKYIYRYLHALMAETCVLEKRYIDKDYMIDYQKFYSRSFNKIRRFTRRLHFFSQAFSSKDFQAKLEKNETGDIRKSYLGFVIVKPIPDEEGNWLLGRTLLRPYPERDEHSKRRCIHSKHPVSLFGIDLEIDSLPFQVQDKGVSACATIALWTAFSALYHLFRLPERAPAEITEASTKLPSEARIFPQGGLSLEQMITCIRSAELDVEIITQVDEEVVATATKAYIDIGIPLIAALRLAIKPEERQPNGPEAEYHAAVIVGYRLNEKGKLVELYVHDDQIGPFSKAEPIGNLTIWKNEWLSPESKFNEVKLEKLLIPIYHKMRLPWLAMYDFHTTYEKDAQLMNCEVDLHLTTVQKYKAYLLKSKYPVIDKSLALKEFLPRFVWVERFHQVGNEEAPLFDHVFDGTAIYPEIVLNVSYGKKK